MVYGSGIPFHRRFGFRTFTSFLSIAIISVTVTAVALYNVSSLAMRRNVSQRNLQIARRAAEEINLYIEDSFNYLESVAEILMPVRDPWVADLMLESTAATYRKFDAIHLIGDTEEVLASSELDNKRAVADSEFLREGIGRSTLHFSEINLSPEGFPYMKVVVPTGTPYGPPLFVYAELNLRDIWNLVDDISFGESGKAVLISAGGLLIAHPDKAKVLSPGSGTLLAEIPEKVAIIGGHYITRDESGTKHLAATDSIPVTGWRIIITQLLSEAFIPLKTIVTGASVVALAAVVSAVFGSLFLVRRFANPLKRLMSGTELIRGGNLDHRIAVDTDDEFGRLSSYFNTMVNELEQWSDRLAVSEKQYRLLTENVNDIIFLLDDDASIRYCNSQVEMVTGYAPEALQGKNVREILDQESGKLVEMYNPSSESGLEVKVITKSGSTVILEAKIVRSEEPGEEVLLYGVARDITERKKAESRLAEYQNELRSLASELILTEARERKKIASLIHDRIGQALSLSRIKLGILSSQALPEEEKQTVNELVLLIKEIIQDTRSLIFTISSPLLYDLGLSAALERLAEQFDAEHEIDFTFSGPDNLDKIDIDISLLLFDSVKELLVNAVKHSRAKSVCIFMRIEEGRVILAVRDDGVGFDVHPSGNGGKKSGGFGLFSIRERLDTIGGSFIINSGSGGSEMVLDAPIEGRERIEHTYSHS